VIGQEVAEMFEINFTRFDSHIFERDAENASLQLYIVFGAALYRITF
jgi:hypothetical protein